MKPLGEGPARRWLVGARSHLSYLAYVMRHKAFVFYAGLKIGAPLWRLLIHDWSKLTPAEWNPYVQKFYGPFKIGGRVDITTFEGIGGPATITATRPGDNPLEVQIDDGYPGEGQRFWAWREEVAGLMEMQDAFARAWRHHIACNPHHWEYWVAEDGLARKMPNSFVLEMVADWAGAGRGITGRWDLAAWYSSNADKIKLHPQSRMLVETTVELLCRLLPVSEAQE